MMKAAKTTTKTITKTKEAPAIETKESLLDCCVAETVTKNDQPVVQRELELMVIPETLCCGVWTAGTPTRIKVLLNPDGTFDKTSPVTVAIGFQNQAVSRVSVKGVK